jgi:hypothetical protein
MAKMNFEQVMEIVDKVRHLNRDVWYQFRSCQAYSSNVVYLYDNEGNHIGNFKLFRSYQTIVALIDYDNQVVYRLGKWSRTTSKQTTQFCNQYFGHFEQVQF